MANLTKAVFQLKVRTVKKLGFTPKLEVEGKHILVTFYDAVGDLNWETVCIASTYAVLKNQQEKYLAWFNEV